MAPRAERPRSPRGRPPNLSLMDEPGSSISRPLSPFPAPVTAPATVSHISVETATASSLGAPSSLLSPPRPRLPTSRSTPSVAAAASTSARGSTSVGGSRAGSPASLALLDVDALGSSRAAAPSSLDARDAQSISPPPVAATPHTPRTPGTPRSRRVSASSIASPRPIRTSSKKGKERAGDAVEADVLGVVSVQGNARRGLRELVARDERRRVRDRERERERERERDHDRDPPIASTKDVTDATPSGSDTQQTFRPRRYYVLTNAGKPVFSINHSDDDTLTNLMGVVQALVSIFAEDDDKLRSVVKGRTRIAFLIKPEMYLFAVSDWGEPEHVLRMQLEYINLQILSVVSASQLARVFARRANFDLSRLLVGSEKFLNKLVETCQDDMSFMTTTLQPLRMPPALRDTAAAALMPPAKFKDLLYVLLIAGGRIVTLLRPRKHAVHPSDMHLLFNTLATSPTLREVETWLPICLPKFNPQGFVHAYISFVREDVGLVFISADRDAFEPLCGWRASVVEQLERDKALDRIAACVMAHPYTVAEIGSPGLRHFVYKSRGMTQITSPEWEEPFTPDSDARKRLVTLYQKAQDALYARPGTGQPQPLRLIYMAGEHEAVLAWLTRPFELYVAVSPLLPMSAVVATANRVAKWVNLEESRLFLRDAPVF